MTAAGPPFDDFLFQFVAVGQGDCCFVRCPDGQVIVVDCGSTKNDTSSADLATGETLTDNAIDDLRSTDFAGGAKNRVSALILTHADQDHYNLVTAMFGVGGESKTMVPLDRIFFSDPGLSKDRSPMIEYTQVLARAVNGDIGTPDVHGILLRGSKTTDTCLTWTVADGYSECSPEPITGTSYRVAPSSEIVDPSWRVDIIAGGVPSTYDSGVDGGTPKNAGSLITLFRIGGRKALFLGDATYATEKFLIDKRKDLISDVDLATIPHHGSAQSSSEAFVEMVNAKTALVSAALLEIGHRLPVGGIIDQWMGRVTDLPASSVLPELDVDAWRPDKGGETSAIVAGWKKKGINVVERAGQELGDDGTAKATVKMREVAPTPENRKKRVSEIDKLGRPPFVWVTKLVGRAEWLLWRDRHKKSLRSTQMATHFCRLSTSGTVWTFGPEKPGRG